MGVCRDDGDDDDDDGDDDGDVDDSTWRRSGSRGVVVGRRGPRVTGAKRSAMVGGGLVDMEERLTIGRLLRRTKKL